MKFAILVAILFTVALSEPPAWFNGINVPWNKFGYDIGTGSFDSNWFDTFFQDCSANHINSARFWLHCDGRGSPTFDNNGAVSGLSSSFLPEMKTLLDKAKSNNVVMMITLWSFDMCKQEVSNGFHPDLISNPDHTRSYIENALIPMLQALSDYENIIYEVINEPEWCITETPGNTKVTVPLSQMQRFVAMIAEAVHENSPHRVTVGSASLKWDSDKVPPAVANWWSDSALQKAYPSQTGKLDFYQIHYYDWMFDPNWGYDPCREPSSYWYLDKPTVVGELPATGGSHYTPMSLLNCSYNNSFVGDMFWAYNADFNWKDAIPAWNTFFSSHSSLASYQNLVAWLKSL